MFHNRKLSVYRFILFLTAVLAILLLPVCAQAASPDDSAYETDAADTEETKTIPDFTESDYGYLYTGESSVVTVPEEITELNHYIFYKNSSIRAIIVPATVSYISDYAIYKCINLRFVCFMSASTRAKDNFIYGVPSLINISAPKSSEIYAKCITDRIPVTSSKNPCFSRKTVYMLPKDTAMMPLYNSTEATYSSSNKKVVAINQSGKIRAKKKGTAIITAVCNGKKYRYKVIVYKKTQSERVKQIRKTEKLSSSKYTIVQKVKAVHDWMIRNVSYDYDSYLSGKIPGVAHTSQGSLIRKLCVCDGYAYGFQKMMKSMGIPCKIVTGTAGGAHHAWNMVQISGKWYHVDVTWDDPIIEGSNANTIPQYNYFLKSSSYMKKHSHTFQEKKYPKCTSKKYDKKGLTGYYNILSEYVYSW